VPVLDSRRIIAGLITSIGLAHGFITIPAQPGSISGYVHEYGPILWAFMYAQSSYRSISGTSRVFEVGVSLAMASRLQSRSWLKRDSRSKAPDSCTEAEASLKSLLGSEFSTSLPSRLIYAQRFRAGKVLLRACDL
jgi:hypothetical protein